MNVRQIVSCMVLAVVPVSLMGADSGAMVQTYGTAWLNGVPVEQPAAVFAGDLVQTSSSAVLKIRTPGSSVTVLSDTVVKFDGIGVSIEHGDMQMGTSKGMFARAGIVTTTPASNGWTEFALTRENGDVLVTAVKGDLQISNGSQTTTLAQGQQTTLKDSDQSVTKKDEPVPAAKKNRKGLIILSSAGGATAAGTSAAIAASLANTPRVISPVNP